MKEADIWRLADYIREYAQKTTETATSMAGADYW